MSKKYKAFNINYNVKFKVNPDMEKEICHYWSGKYHSRNTLDSLFGKADENATNCHFWRNKDENNDF